jgi:two-component system response regulator PilR (NtrC family)
VTKISEEAMKRLLRHAWPGNVRELENVIERAVALETTDTVMPDRLPDPLARAADPTAAPLLGAGFTLDGHLNRIEKELVEEALEKSAGDRGHACELLGVTPRSLRYLIRKHALPAVRG